MKKVFTAIFNAILSVALGIAAIYVISFLNIVPHSMQVDLPHYMYPKIMPATGTTASEAEKARERLGIKVQQQLIEAGIIEAPPTPTPYVRTREEEAQSQLRPYGYPTFAMPLGHSLVQKGYFTVGEDGQADQYFSPGPDGAWYRYDPKNGEVSAVSDDAARIPCSYEDLITFKVSRDPAATVSSDMPEILTVAEPVDDLAKLAESAVKCFRSDEMKGSWFASLLQYRAAGLFLGFTNEINYANRGLAYYLSGENRRIINQVSYNTKYDEFHTFHEELNQDVISSAINDEFYTYDPETCLVGKIKCVTGDNVEGLVETKIGTLPEGYTGPPVVGQIGNSPCCVFAGNSSVQLMDLTNGELRDVPELSPAEGETFSGVSFVFGTDRLVLFYTTNSDPADVQVSQVRYSSLEG